MQITSAKFQISNSQVEKCPDTDLHEYAFIGRSNVGKSSLINMLTGRRKLAMTSSTPGKTTLINHFIINDSWYIVDLPGYGYAQRSKTEREKLKHIIDGYILGRPQMTSLFVLVDSRHEPQKIDLEFMEWLGENGVPFAIVFTKIDKLSRTAAEKNIEDYKRRLLEQWEELPPIFITSSETGLGREELLDYIEELNQLPVQTEFTSEPEQ
ncbi:MAG: YihA family ribosome biogenesis GTP-binding protein [Bacteroidales bacterium]|nr:YihA family ribosome biogenesis GTP-binding protein [Bacteroidales bacterium]MBD5294396.1 YihA family ribosome biogenesis GTP-binding protein [Bacteroides sp.]MDE6033774.1 ribosome biogenesis GTP-binding protein YihA/YsxC [Muribaculaceae bacterium]MBD5342269.1 YihA family ribosome biogenesis GTP-binding protein [Bacteroides sp.]MBD5352356.1 YihA family ribosome biogenesis GTP-binding protein [Bacteroides sp.]